MIDHDNGDVNLSQWVTCRDPLRAAGQLYRELGPDACSAVGLTFPPVPGIRGFEFDEVLDACTPIAIWPQRRCEHAESSGSQQDALCAGIVFKENMCDRMSGLRLQDLPQLVLALRTEVADVSDWQLALLCDDPGRPPRPLGRSLEMPRNRGNS